MGLIPALGRSHTPWTLCRNYWACALEPGSRNYKCPGPQGLQREKSLQREAHTPQVESGPRSPQRKPASSNKDPAPPKIKKKILKKKSTNNKCWRECGEKVTLLHCWWECKLMQPFMAKSMEVPQKTRVLIWFNNPTPGHISRYDYNSKRYMHSHVHSSTIHNSQDMERT